MTSPDTGLYPALLAVKAEIRTLPKDAINPHFRSKYTPLDTIVEHVEPILTKHGLVWLTKPGRDETGEPALAYRLVHATTGEAEEGSMPLLLGKSDPQGQGSAITYARRYALCAVLNLVADEDDDGEATRAAARGQEAKPAKSTSKPKASPKAKGQWFPSAPEIADLRDLCTKAKYDENRVRMALAGVGAGNAGPLLDCLSTLTEPQYTALRELLLQEAMVETFDAKVTT